MSRAHDLVLGRCKETGRMKVASADGRKVSCLKYYRELSCFWFGNFGLLSSESGDCGFRFPTSSLNSIPSENTFSRHDEDDRSTVKTVDERPQKRETSYMPKQAIPILALAMLISSRRTGFLRSQKKIGPRKYFTLIRTYGNWEN